MSAIKIEDVSDDVISTVLGELQSEASDHLAQEIEDAAVRAQLWWRCSECGWVNGRHDATCGGCDLRRAD